MLPLWPAYSDAKARGEFDWIRRTLARSLGATMIFTLVPMAVGAWLAQPLIAAWVGGFSAAGEAARVELPSAALVWLMFTWNALVFIGQPFGYMLAGVSEVKRLTQTSVVSSLVSLILMTVWVESHRQEGVVAGMVVGILPFFLLGNILEARRVLRRFPQRPAADSTLLHAPVVAQGGP
jgi:O-antigen/teichoic acid export membrane protein